MQSLKKNWLLVPKMTWGIRWILMRAVASLKVFNLMGYFSLQHIKFQLKKYRIISHDTEERSKLYRKTDLLYEKWHPKFESLKICTLMGYFCRRCEMFELKKYRGFVSWKITYSFKSDISNGWIFTQVVESNVR